MFKKIKKYRVSLFLLALVAMLSVYYVMIPSDSSPSAPVDNIVGDERYEEFAEMRLRILDDRNVEVATYEVKIIEASSQDVVEQYMLEIDAITELTEKEVMVEEIIIHAGYEDALVFYEDGMVYVSILIEEWNTSVFTDVKLATSEVFDGAKLKLTTYNL